MYREDELMQNLAIVQTLKPHQKLSTSANVYSVQAPGVWSSLLRRWHGEHRLANVSRLVELFEMALTRIELECSRGHSPERLLWMVRQAVVGLNVLGMTYADDIVIASQLRILHSNIEDRLSSCHHAPS